MQSRNAVCITLLAGWLTSAATLAAANAHMLPPDWYPESVAAARDGTLYVGSWRQGAVVRIRPDGATRVLVPPGRGGLANTQGIAVDEARHTLWVCSGNLGLTTVPATPSALKRYDLATGQAQASYPLPDDGYCNDLVVDGAGTVYLTDSYHPRVLRLRPNDSAPAVWLERPALLADSPRLEMNGKRFTFNGIALDGDRLYLSAVAAVPWLWRIDIGQDGQAGPSTRLQMPRPLRNADALRMLGPGRLLVFESNAFGDRRNEGVITELRLDGSQATLHTLVQGLDAPSSGTYARGRLWFIESKYDLLLRHAQNPTAIPDQVPFTVQSIPFAIDGRHNPLN
ncbi:hypothetical protein N8I74_16820 [Chitiniphilus purpureus]|uniref:Gluconolaconase n=1 Tax=Chitiniphilus purpureus TaxID=2981137 RepID=A0ABY6DKS1_9NEIS|nr:hypothetical protein [Chitiniphilus sp. CD1]UXY14962.1 hypothetical protein N8I74_16820 [Chitiniphilus sp. CD1]